MAHHAVVAFLENREYLKGVDPEFRELADHFHRIPFCATFGVSCAGHFYEEHCTEECYIHRIDNNHPATDFWPKPFGNLNIIVMPTMPYLQELLRVLQEKIGSYPDASFQKINHVFGPPENSGLEVWEIRIGDNGCLDSLGEDYCGGYLPIEENMAVYELSKKRVEEIKTFWKDLIREVADFCRQQGFKRSAVKTRVRELEKVWIANAADTQS